MIWLHIYTKMSSGLHPKSIYSSKWRPNLPLSIYIEDFIISQRLYFPCFRLAVQYRKPKDVAPNQRRNLQRQYTAWMGPSPRPAIRPMREHCHYPWRGVVPEWIRLQCPWLQPISERRHSAGSRRHERTSLLQPSWAPVRKKKHLRTHRYHEVSPWGHKQSARKMACAGLVGVAGCPENASFYDSGHLESQNYQVVLWIFTKTMLLTYSSNALLKSKSGCI